MSFISCNTSYHKFVKNHWMNEVLYSCFPYHSLQIQFTSRVISSILQTMQLIIICTCYCRKRFKAQSCIYLHYPLVNWEKYRQCCTWLHECECNLVLIFFTKIMHKLKLVIIIIRIIIILVGIVKDYIVRSVIYKV